MPEEEPLTERQHKAAHRRRRVKEVKTKLSNMPPSAATEAISGVVSTQTRKQFGGFADFLREQSVVGIGIGIVFGAQVKVVVDAIMLGFVNPITKLVLPGGESLAAQTFTLKFDGKTATILWGSIVYSLLTFIIVAVIIYATYKLLKLDKFRKEK